MGKMNVNKVTGLSSARAIGPNEIKNADSETISHRPIKTVAEVDKIELSETASEVGRLVDRVKALPDPVNEKVTSFRAQIAAGSYDPASEDIADAILKTET